MASKNKTKAPAETLREAEYLQQLTKDRTHVRVRLTDNSEYDGHVEFFDAAFIRLTRDAGPNLFLFKHDIKYLMEI